MDIIKEDAFRKLIKSGLSGAYLFFGEEDYMKAFSVKSAREAVCADATFEIFNDVKIDALDYSAPKLLDALMPFPMMAEQKIVTVNGLCLDDLKASEIDDLCDVLGTLSEYDYNVLIISVPSGGMNEGSLPKKPSALLTKLSKYLTPVRFEPIPPSRLAGWVAKHFAHNGIGASPQVCSFLIDYSGASMFTLASEIDKISYYLLWNGRNTVSEDDVKNICSAEISSDSFALANAIVDGKSDKALDALAVMKFHRIDPIIVLGEVSKVICDLTVIKSLLVEGRSVSEISSALNMNEYRVKIYAAGAAGKPMEKLKQALELCSQADMSLKNSALGYIALERFICAL